SLAILPRLRVRDQRGAVCRVHAALSDPDDALLQRLHGRAPRRAAQGAVPEARVHSLRVRAPGLAARRAARRLSRLRRSRPPLCRHADLASRRIQPRHRSHGVSTTMNDQAVDLHDVQGNIIKAYPRFGFPRARYLFFRINNGKAGRQFLSELLPHITTSAPWLEKGAAADGSARPEVTMNVALTFEGLRRLGVPQASLQSFPEAFASGMRARRAILGDDGPSAPDKWDPIWQDPDPVHLFVAISGGTFEQIQHCQDRILALRGASTDAIQLLDGHRGPSGKTLPYQDASAIFINDEATPREHFGYADGISNVFFKGSLADSSNVVGGGKRNASGGWEPLETGEF